MDADDDRTITQLLIEQIEFANVIVLNKIDLVDETGREQLKSILRSLNPNAVLIESSFGVVEPSDILNTGRFNFDEAANAPGWLQVMRGEEIPESDEYGIRSFSYSVRRPFHPERLWQLLNARFEGVLRSKGFFWLATDPAVAATWSQAGSSFTLGILGNWFSTTIPAGSDLPENVDAEDIPEGWDPVYGDRGNQLVFIGQNVDFEFLEQALDSALLTEEESVLGPKGWVQLVNPFAEVMTLEASAA